MYPVPAKQGHPPPEWINPVRCRWERLADFSLPLTAPVVATGQRMQGRGKVCCTDLAAKLGVPISYRNHCVSAPLRPAAKSALL